VLGHVLLTVKKGKTLLTARNAKLGTRCTFAKTISLAKGP
jgi:DNA polymerase III sliding clamp (beta) subunit (PCNA family)